jgi:hypothetical protein
MMLGLSRPLSLFELGLYLGCYHRRYQHMFMPELGPSLSFVGLPWKVVPFPQFELQAKLIARCAS